MNSYRAEPAALAEMPARLDAVDLPSTGQWAMGRLGWNGKARG
ncbi:MAG TPA: hypothetical protein VJ302_16050 [Blastocatellia bacterium]|nr:hypothetical protein [Blastocatellia bacterium]